MKYREKVEKYAADLFNIDQQLLIKTDHKWSKKEILGHLIDSASNNHQRFVRFVTQGETEFKGYRQDEWVAFQQYDKKQWIELVNLWMYYNFHLCTIIESLPETKLNELIRIDEKTLTITESVEHYFKHMEHHLEQIL